MQVRGFFHDYFFSLPGDDLYQLISLYYPLPSIYFQPINFQLTDYYIQSDRPAYLGDKRELTVTSE